MYTQTTKSHSPGDIYILMHICETIIIKEREANNLRESGEDGKERERTWAQKKGRRERESMQLYFNKQMNNKDYEKANL